MALGSSDKLGRAATLIAVLVLAACSPPQRMVWNRDGASYDQTRADQKDCLADSSSFGFLSDNTATGGGISTGLGGGGINNARSQQADIYRSCMARKGYSQYPADKVPRKPGQDQSSDQ